MVRYAILISNAALTHRAARPANRADAIFRCAFQVAGARRAVGFGCRAARVEAVTIGALRVADARATQRLGRGAQPVEAIAR
ncbi:MAG: hypothetical protein BVN33_08080 [Proteobacteria bacterium ST_bin13]|nr:MAG: hypothetical protein BVN33_08080 [Proteobacteria bacterium ST_bin13]